MRMADIAQKVGISRQALYLHFSTRAELLVALTHFVDEVNDVDSYLAASRAAQTGRERLDAFIEGGGGYIPKVFPVAKALMAMYDTDDAAHTAWDGRLAALRHGCEAAVRDLKRDGDLRPGLSAKQATDLLWMLLSFENWERLRLTCGWSQKRFIEELQHLARAAVLKD